MIAALDATYSVGSSLSGVGVYSREILRALAELCPNDTFVQCYRPHRLWRGIRAERLSNVFAAPLFDSWAPFRCDLFHGLNQRLPRHRFRRAVSTFHDLFVMTSEYSTPEFRSRFTLQAREAAERADLIICVSEFTARQVESLLKVERSRLRVVHHGTRFVETPVGTGRQPWILHVGAVQARKNLVRLIDAFELAAPAPWRLVLVGSEGFGAEQVREHAAASSARDRIEFHRLGRRPAAAELYANSSVMAFPSLDEGFGIPVLEAMAWGLPVIASNGSSLPEVCGNAALLVDPTDTAALATAMRTFIEDPAFAAGLASKGREQARHRPLERCRGRDLRVYTELLS